VTKQNATVLVVDDQDSGRFVKAQLMRRAGYTVYEASTGREALDVTRSAAIDLVVLDVNLPDISGLEVGRLLRDLQPGPPAIQILHVSSTAVEESDRAKGLNYGADAYLPEPIDSGVLVATANALMRVRRAEQSLADALAREQKAREEAEQANRIKDDFIATLSHELRTPLNALMGWIFQLRQTSLTDSARARALDSLERNTRVQAQLINDLLDVSRVAKGKLQLQLRVVNIATVVRDAIESVSAVARQKGVDLDVSTQPAHVAGDEARLQQIVGNLLNNAIQFTPEGGRITLVITLQAGTVVVRITDTGAGIEPALLPYVFEPFRQGKDGLARVHGGLGLGLAVVQQLVELHDGTAVVTSEGPGRGTTFTVSFPEMAAAGQQESASQLLLQDLEVLVLADTAESRDMLTAMLESAGARVTAQPAQSATMPPADVVVRDRGQDVVVLRPAASPASTEARISKPVKPGALVRAAAALGSARLATIEAERQS
jgi:two-component system, sensor histidine kinase